MVFATFKALGLDDSKLQTGTAEDLTNGVLDKRLIGITKASGNVELDSQLLTIQASTPIKLLGLTEAQWKKFQDADPLRAYVRFDLPANTLKALPGHPAIITQSFITGCQGNSDLPQDVAYQMIKVAVSTWDEWGAVNWKSNGFYNVVRDQLKDWPASPHAPLHAGTVQFLKEKGVTVPAEFIPPEYKGP